jgi:hypothetical protein
MLITQLRFHLSSVDTRSRRVEVKLYRDRVDNQQGKTIVDDMDPVCKMVITLDEWRELSRILSGSTFRISASVDRHSSAAKIVDSDTMPAKAY